MAQLDNMNFDNAFFQQVSQSMGNIGFITLFFETIISTGLQDRAV